MVSALLALLIGLAPVLFSTLLINLLVPASAHAAPGRSDLVSAVQTASVDPAYPYVGYLRSTISSISPTVVSTSVAGDLMTVIGTISNVSKAPIYDLRYVWQRGNPLSSVGAIKTEITAPSRPSAVVDQDWRVLAARSGVTLQTDLAPGASMPFVATVAIGDSTGLDLHQRGVYPLMIKVSGDIGQDGRTQYERVGEIHLLGTVLTGPPAAVSATGGGAGAGSSSDSNAPSTLADVAQGPTGADPTSDHDSVTSSTDIPTQGFPTRQTLPSADANGTAGDGTDGSAPTAGASSVTRATASSPAPAAGTTPTATTTITGHSVALNMLWPLVDTPHVGLQGVFLNDDLTREIVPGGRLYDILTALTSLNAGASATTVVVDPELLAELEQMSVGYRVVSQRGVEQAPLTPTSETPAPTTTAEVGSTVPTNSGGSGSAPHPGPPNSGPATARPTTAQPIKPIPGRTTSTVGRPPAEAGRTSVTTRTTGRTVRRSTGHARTALTTPTIVSPTPDNLTTSATATGTASAKPPANTTAGTGQSAAVAFLTKLRAAVAGQQVLVLPYSDPDSVAMIRAGLNVQLAGLVSMGRVVAARVLQVGRDQPRLVTDLALPAGGDINDATLAFLSTQGMSTALLSPATLQHPGGSIGSAVVDERPNNGAVVRTAVTDADLLGPIDDLIAKGNSTGLATRVSNLAALLTGSSIDGTGTPLVIAPDNRWTPGLPGLGVLHSLLTTLASGRVVTGTPLHRIAAAATAPATLAYPDSAQQAELDPGYLAEVLHDANWAAGLKSSLSTANGDTSPVPADVLDPVATALISAGSAGLRTDGYVGHSILRTIHATLASLRAGVTIAGGTSYTLAASTSPLLVTVRNDLPYVVKVRVVILGGETVGMTATDPGAQSIPAGQSHQFRIDTKVVKAGKFPVNAQLKAVDGSDWSDPTTITVNSSAYGTLTIILIVVAGGALTLMVAIRLVQRVRNRQPPADDQQPGGQHGPASSANPQPDSILGSANAPADGPSAADIATAGNPAQPSASTGNAPVTGVAEQPPQGPAPTGSGTPGPGTTGSGYSGPGPAGSATPGSGASERTELNDHVDDHGETEP